MINIDIFLISILFFLSCSELKTSDKSNVEKTQRTESSLSTEGVAAINDLKQFLDYKKTTARSSQDIGSFDLDKYQLKQITYYRFNEEKFYQNPEPNKLTSCFEIDSNLICFVGMENEDVGINFVMKHMGDSWLLTSSTLEWGIVMSRVRQSVGTGDFRYRILDCGEYRFILLEKGELFEYYNFLGKKFTEDQVCILLLNIINEKRKSRDISSE